MNTVTLCALRYEPDYSADLDLTFRAPLSVAHGNGPDILFTGGRGAGFLRRVQLNEETGTNRVSKATALEASRPVATVA